MEYTCPMHPQIRADKVGICPICGMDLEPVIRTEHEDEKLEEYFIWARRFWISLILSIPIVLFSMWGMKYPWGQFLLTTCICFGAGASLYVRAWASVINRKLNMFSLIGLGTGAAYLFSAVALIFPEIFSDSMKVGKDMPLYFESVAVIVTLVLLGQMLEARARGKTGMALSLLMKEAPKIARRLDAEGEHEVSILEIKVGDHLRVLSGEKIPVDGVLLEGESHIDESILTGESIPVKKEKGDKVMAGAINQEGSFIMIAEKVGEETLFAQIAEMVAKAQRTLPPIQRIVDKVSEYFVPIVIGIAVVTFILWAIWGSEPRVIRAFVYAVSVLIIACPCALGLATPISIIVGIGRSAQKGILIKNAEALEVMHKVTTLVIDKTGTLTEGFPGITDIIGKKGMSQEELLQLAASIEQGSEHPIAKAVLREAQKHNINLFQVKNFEAIAGSGVKGIVEDRLLMIGSLFMIKQWNVALSDDLQEWVYKFQREAKTVLYVADSQEVIGILAVADLIKATSFSAVKQIQSLGIKIIMLTGDNEGVAKYVADKVGIDNYHAGINPIEKAGWIEKLQAEGEVVAMAGDGINDAISLAKADVGIAMGTGAGVALESAGVTLVHGDLQGIKNGILLSRLTWKNILENLFFAFIYNCIGIPIAAGILYPFWGISLSPMIAGAAMTLSSISVLLNALRLRQVRID